MEIVERITLDQIIAAKPKMIFYGANTCWWTHDPAHLSKTPPATEAEVRRMADVFKLNARPGTSTDAEFLRRAREATKHRIPCDPRGGMLFETDNVEGFLENARSSAEYYGKHGLRAFIAAHHLNCILSVNDPRPWCEKSWDAYNEALDRRDAR